MKKIPNFSSEVEESQFWRENDTASFIEWENAQKASFPNLKPSLKSISLRLPESMIEKLKVIANKKDVPYQSLMKVYLSNMIEQEYKKVF